MPIDRSYLVAFLIVVGGCMGRPDPQHLVVPLSTGAALSSPDSPGIGVRLTFNGEAAWFVFDTGAAAHTFARWFVESAALEIDSSYTGLAARDATGGSVQLLVVHGLVGGLEGGDSLRIGTGVVAGFPPMFEAAQIGGLLNPQLLAEAATAVVLDLRVPELRLEPFDRAVRRLGAAVSDEEEVEVCVSDAAAIPNRIFAIRVSSGDRDGWLKLDTGADVTSIRRGSSLLEGVELEAGGISMGVAGQLRRHDLARDLVLVFAGHTVMTSAQVVEPTLGACGNDGLLGLDAVGRCALILGRESIAFACSP
jgi:hypothetical protein